MLNRLADRVRLRANTDAATPVRGVSPVTPQSSRDLLVGDEVQAQVHSTQPGGLFRVLIDHQAYLLRLPFQAKPGDTIQLTVTARQPTLRFEMNEYPQGTTVAPRLSDTARFITALLAECEKLPVAPAAASGTPLTTAPPAAAPLASALGRALTESGMFYESHLAQWVAGERALVSLRQEPQANLPVSPHTGDVAIDSPPGSAQAATGATDLPAHRDALPIVRQQLETLETGHVAWRGLVWNEQALEWHVEDHPRHQDPSPAPGDALADVPWQTRISLTLPQLGMVSATLSIGKHGASIALHAAAPGTISLLDAQCPALRQSLADAGIRPLGITVEPHDLP